MSLGVRNEDGAHYLSISIGFWIAAKTPDWEREELGPRNEIVDAFGLIVPYTK